MCSSRLAYQYSWKLYLGQGQRMLELLISVMPRVWCWEQTFFNTAFTANSKTLNICSKRWTALPNFHLTNAFGIISSSISSSFKYSLQHTKLAVETLGIFISLFSQYQEKELVLQETCLVLRLGVGCFCRLNSNTWSRVKLFCKI